MKSKRTIPSFPDYSITKAGRVWSRSQDRWVGSMTGAENCRLVSLVRGKDWCLRSIHRLVLETFVGACPEGMEAQHWNDNRGDNRLENLRWAKVML